MKTIISHLVALAPLGRLSQRHAPFVRYLLVLVAVVVLYGWVFHILMVREGQEHSWFTGIYWALTVMSTLGFGDITFVSDLGRAFSTLVLISGVLLLLIILPFLFIRFVYTPWLEQQSYRRLRALRSVPADVSDHVIICANDPIATGLIGRLQVAGIPAYVIEPDPVTARQMHDEGCPVITGEIDATGTYAAARVEHARLLFANASDTVNSNVVLTARELTSTVPILAIAESEDSVDILELSGASQVLPLKRRLGEHLASRVSVGSARANVIGKFDDLVLAEFPVHETPFQGRRIRETKLREVLGVTIVAAWERGSLRRVEPDYLLEPASMAIVMGTSEQIRDLDEAIAIYDANPNPVIVIGGGKVGCSAARVLRERGARVHMVERDESVSERIGDVPDRLFVGDAADRVLLERAGIRHAPSILLTTHDDAMNVYLTVYCRRLNPNARILTRVTHHRTIEAIVRAGADFVLSYAALGVEAVSSAVEGRELLMVGVGVGLFDIPLPAGLAGQTLAAAEICERTGLIVIAVRQNGRIRLQPFESGLLGPGSALMALGTPEQRRAFGESFEQVRSPAVRSDRHRRGRRGRRRNHSDA